MSLNENFYGGSQRALLLFPSYLSDFLSNTAAKLTEIKEITHNKNVERRGKQSVSFIVQSGTNTNEAITEADLAAVV